ncbi:hypothetical protein BDQ12DRAFT_679188 [Crucibulum laeve]|uniref:Uncharacterized protein n=1 Tax=Crucibulum laeve TaxID=68775 RepID=A0A5C3M9B5_9AGAR|nr:hypothetical protein BDQ12DRAFT_679188 [Crucibulum laeve]
MHPCPLRRPSSFAKHLSLPPLVRFLVSQALDACHLTSSLPPPGPKVNTVEKLSELRRAGVNVGM